MRCPEHLRAEVGRLHQTIRTTSDPVLRKRLAECAMGLAQHAEAIANLPDDVEGLYVVIAHYGRMLAAAANDEPKRRLLSQILEDAEDRLRQVNSIKRLPSQRQAA